MLDDKFDNKQELSVQEMSGVISGFDGWERVYPGTASRNNRALAQFKNKDGRTWHCYIGDGVGKDVYPPFATEWSFLIPVWNKCLPFLDVPGYAYYLVGFKLKFHLAVDENDIISAHRVVFDFITEYKKQSNA